MRPYRGVQAGQPNHLAQFEGVESVQAVGEEARHDGHAGRRAHLVGEGEARGRGGGVRERPGGGLGGHGEARGRVGWAWSGQGMGGWAGGRVGVWAGERGSV